MVVTGHGDLDGYLDDNLDVDGELVEVHDAVESCSDPLREPNQATNLSNSLGPLMKNPHLIRLVLL